MDRNCDVSLNYKEVLWSLSARRAWIEIDAIAVQAANSSVALRKESVDRNTSIDNLTQGVFSRSPQGERG